MPGEELEEPGVCDLSEPREIEAESLDAFKLDWCRLRTGGIG